MASDRPPATFDVERAEPGTNRGRPALFTHFVAATTVTRLLVTTQLAFNIGFYMVLPYLSVYLMQDLQLAVVLVGLTLGLRTFAQQGLFVFGGLLADRWGTKATVLLGCALRVVGFVALAAAHSLAAVLAATVAIGLAGALFSPAVEAALARESAGDHARGRADAFALFAVFGQIGAFTGPLAGAVLLLVDFRACCLVAAAVFVAVLVAQLAWLPNAPAAHRGESLTDGWHEVITNRTFMLFAVAFSAQLVAYNQLYLLLPLEVERAWSSHAPLGWLFAGSSILVVCGQLRLTKGLQGLPRSTVLPGGLVLIAAGFFVVALCAPAELSGAIGLLPAVAFIGLLTVGEMAILPFARELVPVLAGERRLGAHYGCSPQSAASPS